MKILQIGKFYPILGGVEKVMYDLTVGLSQRGIDCDMLCASADGEHGSFSLNPHGNLIVVPALTKAAATMISPAMITRLKKIAGSYDIIHIHHPDPMAALSLRLSGFRGKVVLHWHSDILKQKKLLRFYEPLQNWLLRRADKVVCTSPSYAEGSPWLQEVKGKLSIIPIGILPMQAAASEDVDKIRNRYPGKRIILSVGRLVAYKGYEHLILAARNLPDDCVLLISGEGPLHDSLERLIAETGTGNKIKLLGRVPEEEIVPLFNAADIFCLPSVMKTEAFGIVQLEAMSLGKPVVATNIPGSGTGWVNAHNVSGLNVAPADSDALAKAINRLLADRKLHERLSAGARRRFEENFTLPRMIDDALEIYKRL